MNPFYFGTGERRLFGIYEAAQRLPARRAVLLCHPWGPDYVHAYRAQRQLAKMLTAAGMHVMRFDYYGTGDSAGETTAGDPDSWTTDIGAALEELQDTTETTRISVVGLRLGAVLAAQAAARSAARSDIAIESLVLWDPVIRGTEYLAELHAAGGGGRWWRKPAPRRPAADGGGHEIMGFPLTDRMAAGIRGIDLAALAPDLPARTLVVTSQSASAKVAAVARPPLGPLAVESIADEPAWIEWPIGHPLSGTVPVKVLQRIVEWLA
jgi:pimeloyl-ACP methyl ester carboxylesterase